MGEGIQRSRSVTVIHTTDDGRKPVGKLMGQEKGWVGSRDPSVTVAHTTNDGQKPVGIVTEKNKFTLE